MYAPSTTTLRSLPSGGKLNYKWYLSLIMVAVLTLGWKFPLLGFVVPVAMTAGIAGGFFRGRWVCGNLCPRGSFLDTWFNLVSARKKSPSLLRKGWFRWTMLTLLMGFMTLRLAQNPTDLAHWGLVFWQMCLVTTLLAVILGLRYSARSWCAFCPVGTLAATVGAGKYQLQISPSCKACGLCEASCPMNLAIATHRETGVLPEKDCLKCSACVDACPRSQTLRWPG